MQREPQDIFHLIEQWAESAPDSLALLAPGRSPLTYQQLYAHLGSVGAELSARGIGSHDPVAIALPNGPEMATAFVAIASQATAAPLNTHYSPEEFDFYLTDLGARALIIQAGSDSPIRSVATAHGLPVFELSPRLDAEAGLFTLAGQGLSAPASDVHPCPTDRALILHTSGTTSKPKQVPLSRAHLFRSARQIQQALELAPEDRCLNIMPLFHVHGLVAAVLASFAAGASVVCTSGLYAPEFFSWMETFRPTWYTAVPTMHQAILARAAARQEKVVASSLRFIRSCSSALPPQVFHALEATFDVPVLEAYGMTEASHQIASNPLPPRQRKVGSVGLAAGTELAILDEQANLVSAGKVGEIVIRGANVMQSYEHNPTANAQAFVKGWFRTGDQGYLDSDGYLVITGRLKDIINRGGEKISPREVDEVLLSHAAIVQAVAFALPDERLGEEVAVAVVLKTGMTLSEREVQAFASQHLAAFKVPRYVVILKEIPTGPTGKIQRFNLAKMLGPLLLKAGIERPEREFVAPRTRTEKALASIWSQVLDLEPISIHDTFLELGGDSMLATRILSNVSATLKKEISIPTFFTIPTICDQALYLDGV